MKILFIILGIVLGVVAGNLVGYFNVYSIIAKHNMAGEDRMVLEDNVDRKERANLAAVGILILAVGVVMIVLLFNGKTDEIPAAGILLISAFAFFLGGLLLYAGITGKAHRSS